MSASIISEPKRKLRPLCVDGYNIVVSGWIRRIARLQDEYYQCLGEPESIIRHLKMAPTGASLFTFLQEIADITPVYGYRLEWESLAVLPIDTYDDWWKRRINDKTRNRVRKAERSGVELRLCNLDDHFIEGIREIYNESNVRQGKRFRHYGKSFEEIKASHATYPDRSRFIGAYCGGELIGFVKLVEGKGAASMMQIISKISQREKCATNALIARCVQMCAEAGIPLLHYGLWSRRGIGNFKKHHGFARHDVPRYYVPLDALGRLLIGLNLHRPVAEYIPNGMLDRLVTVRGKWLELRHGKPTVSTG